MFCICYDLRKKQYRDKQIAQNGSIGLVVKYKIGGILTFPKWKMC